MSALADRFEFKPYVAFVGGDDFVEGWFANNCEINLLGVFLSKISRSQLFVLVINKADKNDFCRLGTVWTSLQLARAVRNAAIEPLVSQAPRP